MTNRLLSNRWVAIVTCGLLTLGWTSCSKFDNNRDGRVEIPQFNFPSSVDFQQELSTYAVYADATELLPADDFHLLELSSVLFTDHAHKQRLVHIPDGQQMVRNDDGSVTYPDGTVLVKTFFYYIDERDHGQGKDVIETRLLIKENGLWNAATYVWNSSQTEATLLLDGQDMQLSWIDMDGQSLSTNYHIPSENECATCHQSKMAMSPLGPTLRNLNRTVHRSQEDINQLTHLQQKGILNDFSVELVDHIVDYKDASESLDERGRAYLAMNCAHCHNPNGWSLPAERDFDFRYDTPLSEAGILNAEDRILEAVLLEEMPFIGTSMLDEEGALLLIDYLESL